MLLFGLASILLKLYMSKYNYSVLESTHFTKFIAPPLYKGQSFVAARTHHIDWSWVTSFVEILQDFGVGIHIASISFVKDKKSKIKTSVKEISGNPCVHLEGGGFISSSYCNSNQNVNQFVIIYTLCVLGQIKSQTDTHHFKQVQYLAPQQA